MGFDIEGQSLYLPPLTTDATDAAKQSNTPPSTSKPAPFNLTQTVGNIASDKPVSLEMDELLSNVGVQNNIETTTSSLFSGTPILSSNGVENAISSLTQINQLIEKYALPQGKDLANNLSNETKEKISDFMMEHDEDGNMDRDMKVYFNQLSNLYPVTLSLLSGILGENGQLHPDQMLKEVLNLLKELGSLTNLHSDALNLPEETKSQVQSALKELAQIAEPHSNPSDLDKNLEHLLSQFQTGKPMSGKQLKGIFKALSSLVDVLGMVKTVPRNHLNAAFTSMLAMKNIESQTHAAGLLGPKLTEFTNNIAKFLAGIQQSLKEASQLEEAPVNRFNGNALGQIVLSAGVFGRLITGFHPGGKASDEEISLSLLKFEAAKDLKLLDRIPFSLISLYPDLDISEQAKEHSSDAHKEANFALSGLIRVILRVVFVLSAIVSAGNHLGTEGMNRMLEENTFFITDLLNNLIFALKKVDENFIVNVSFHTALAQGAKDALTFQNYDEFWNSIIHMFAPKTELASFLKDMEEAKPLFNVIESMLSESKQNLPNSFPLAM